MNSYSTTSIISFALSGKSTAFLVLIAVCICASNVVAQQPTPNTNAAPTIRQLEEPLTAPDRSAFEFSDDAPDVFDLGLGVGFASGPSSALTTVGGYIDSAIISNRVRYRFDAAYNNPVPDRNQFFYPEDGAGGLGAETRIDYQDAMTYIEWATHKRFSLFVELGARFLNPELNPNTAGLGDMNAGFRYAIRQCPREALTFQLRTYIGTGDARARGLGVGFTSIEPALLHFRRLSDRLTLEGELRGWIPLADNQVRSGPFVGEDFSGEMLRYGVGLGYDLFKSCGGGCRQPGCGNPSCGSTFKLVGELVGWTILEGFGTFSDGITSEVRDVSGDTIVNLKLGGRYTRGRNTFYAGWGHVITSDQWYEDILRVEYEMRF